VLTRGLVWAGLALFVFFLLTRLRTLAILAATRQGLREAAAVRIRAMRLAVELLAIVAILSLWAARTLDRGYFDWDVGGSGSPLRLKLAGAWFIVGAVGLTASVTALLVITGMMAFARAMRLRQQFPRSAAGRPHVLRLAVMNPGVVFVAPRRSPFVWVWTEVRAAAFGVVTTLAIEAVGHELPVSGLELSETVDEATDEFELEDRLTWRGRALTWNELLEFLATGAGVTPEPDQLVLPPADVPFGARALGYWLALFGVMRKARREAQRKAALAKFDERATIRTILEHAPGPLAQTYLTRELDGLLHQVRGEVFDSLKRQHPRQHSHQLAKVYRRDGMDGAAAWMIENVASYPELFRHSVSTELDRQASLVDSIVSEVLRPS
jgi:hypothetical protein